MLALILVYFIGKYFYTLAENYNQNKWLYAILGVISYYAGAFIGGIILGLADVYLGLGIDYDNNILMTLIALPIGIGFVYLFYYLLKKKWENTVIEVRDEIQDIGKSINKIDE